MVTVYVDSMGVAFVTFILIVEFPGRRMVVFGSAVIVMLVRFVAFSFTIMASLFIVMLNWNGSVRFVLNIVMLNMVAFLAVKFIGSM